MTEQTTERTASHDTGHVDVRGPRFGAALTSGVLALALVVQGTVGIALLAWQTAVFAVATVAGPSLSPYARLFRVVVARLDLGPAPALEPSGPPRFAQACGLAVAILALLLHAVGATTAAWTAVGAVLALALLQAAIGLCVGCEIHNLLRRVRERRSA